MAETTCALCGALDRPEKLARGLCSRCLNAFVAGYVAGHAAAGNECGCGYTCSVAVCPHGDIETLCGLCAQARVEARAARDTRVEAIAARLRAARSKCIGCEKEINPGGASRFCLSCAEIAADSLVRWVMKNPPPKPAPHVHTFAPDEPGGVGACTGCGALRDYPSTQ
jgi:hypothetical protein